MTTDPFWPRCAICGEFASILTGWLEPAPCGRAACGPCRLAIARGAPDENGRPVIVVGWVRLAADGVPEVRLTGPARGEALFQRMTAALGAPGAIAQLRAEVTA